MHDGTAMLGIDIGNRSIKVCELELVGATAVVSAAACVDMAEAVVPPGGSIDAKRLCAALTEALHVAGCNAGPAVLNLPVTEIAAFARLRFPVMKPRELFAGPLWREMDDRIPFPVDHENVALALDPAGDGTGHTALSMAAIPRATVRAYEDVALSVGLKPVACTLDGLAWSAWLLAAGVGADAPVLGVHVGSCTTTLISLQRGVVQSLRWIASGGEDVTRGLMERLAMDRPAAEALKKRIGIEAQAQDPGYRDPSAGVERAVIELVEEIAGLHAEQIVGIAKESCAGLSSAPKLVLAGGGADLEQLAAELRRRWQGPVDQDCGVQRVQLGARVDRQWFRDHRARLGPVLGLALGNAPSIALGKARKAIPRWKRRRIPMRARATSAPTAAQTEVSPLFQSKPGRRPIKAHVVALTVGLVHGGGFALAAAGFFATYVEHRHFEAAAATASGTVVDHRWFKGSKKGNSQCCAVVEFEAEGRKHQFTNNACHSSCEPDKGAAVDVLYRTTDPSDVRLQVDVAPLPYFAGVLGPIGVAGCVLGVVVYRRGKRKEGEPR